MSLSEWFGEQDLGAKYAIVLSLLALLTVSFAVCKLIYTKQRVKRFKKEAEDLQSREKEEKQNLNQMAEEEGDLFGIRALEKGFYGGVAQSRPVTPVSSRSLVPPSLALLPDRQSPECYARRFHSIADPVKPPTNVPPSTLPRAVVRTYSSSLLSQYNQPRTLSRPNCPG